MNINYIFFPIVFILISILSFSPFGVKQTVWFCKSDNSKNNFIISYDAAFKLKKLYTEEEEDIIKSQNIKYRSFTYEEPYKLTDQIKFDNKLYTFNYFLNDFYKDVVNEHKDLILIKADLYNYYLDINIQNNEYRLFSPLISKLNQIGELIEIEPIHELIDSHYKSCNKIEEPVFFLLEEGSCKSKKIIIHNNLYNKENILFASNDKAFDGCVIFE